MALENTGQLDKITELLAEEGLADTSQPNVPPSKDDEEEQVDKVSENEDEDENTTDDVDNDSSDESEDKSDESSEDENVTWGKVLEVPEEQLVLDDDGNFSGIKVKVDEVETTVKLPELIKGYQTNKYNTQKSQALAEEFKNFQTVKETVAQEYTKKLEDLQKLSEYMQSSLLQEFRAIDWDRLRNENPGEYAAAVQDYNIRKAEIDKIYSSLNQEREQKVQEMTAEQQQAFQAKIGAEVEKVLVNNPEWRDESKLKAAISELQDFVSESYGFSAEEFQHVQDARLIELIKDAMKFRKGQQVAQKKIEKPVPKFQKSTGKKPKTTSKLDLLTKQAKSATGVAKRRAETAAITELLLRSGG